MLISVLLSIPLAIANPHYETGRVLLGEKKSTEAIQAFKQCIAETPKADPVSIDCHWEMGWAYWLKNDWSNVIKHWEIVQKSQPDRADLNQYLGQAPTYWSQKLLRRSK